MDYSKLPTISSYDVTCAKNYGQTRGRDPEVLAKLFVETDLIKLEKEPSASSYEHGEAIGLRRIDCPWCGWKTTDRYSSGRMVTLPLKGGDTGVLIRRRFPCRCRMYEKLYSRWSGPRAMVPKAYQQFLLPSLEPSKFSRLLDPDQADVIKELQANPFKNFLFVGPPQTGKTVFTTALFSAALIDWAKRAWIKQSSTESVWRVVVMDYLQQELDYDRKRELKITDGDGNQSYVDPPEPIVSRRKVREAIAAGLVPRLFLEEIDKIPNLTRGRAANLFGIVNEVYEQGGQIVVNANKSVESLKILFGEDDGEALVRRFTHDRRTSKGMLYDFRSYPLKPQDD